MGVVDTGHTARHGCYAGIPGTGPERETCGRCRWLLREGTRRTCAKYRSLTGRNGGPIDAGSPACRYFGRRP
jgi:hypothetical protein